MQRKGKQPSRRDLLLGAAGIGLAAAGHGAAAGEASPRRFFRITSGSSGGVYYPLASLISAAVSNPTNNQGCDIDDVCGVPGLIAVAQTSAGSLENLNRLLEGDAESAFCQADVALRCASGELDGIPLEMGQHLRVIAYLYPEYLHVVVRRGRGIRKLADLAGKRVSLGAMGSATYRDSEVLLQALGVEQSALKVVDISAVAAARELREGSLDGFLLISGVPANAVRSLASDRLIDLLPVEGAAAQRFAEARPPFQPALIQSWLYDHIPITHSLSVGALWLVRDDLPADLIYEITRALWSRATAEYLQENEAPLAPQINIDKALTDIGMPPLHPGAALFYRQAALLDS